MNGHICLKERARFAKRTARERARSASEQRVKTLLWLLAFWTLFMPVGAQRPEHLETCCFGQNVPKELPLSQQKAKFEKSVPKYFSRTKEIRLPYILMLKYWAVFVQYNFSQHANMACRFFEQLIVSVVRLELVLLQTINHRMVVLFIYKSNSIGF